VGVGEGEVSVDAADGRREPAPARRWLRRLGWVAVTLLALAVLALGWWVLRYPTASALPVAAVEADPAVRVVTADGVVSLHPSGGPATTALVFYPGGGVPPEAYLPPLARVVQAAEVSVHVPTMPLRLAVLRPGRADAVIEAHPEVDSWWAGGHSLGGAMAASYAGRSDPGELAGLVLWAAYATEAAGLADRDDLVVLSVSGAEDGLSTPDDLAARRHLLPAGTTFVELAGVTHAQFGAYGEQAGDGLARVSDEEAWQAIADAVAPVLAGS
jgi:dienelactone hydrolase